MTLTEKDLLIDALQARGEGLAAAGKMIEARAYWAVANTILRGGIRSLRANRPGYSYTLTNTKEN